MKRNVTTLPPISGEHLHRNFFDKPGEPTGSGGRHWLAAREAWNRGNEDAAFELWQAAIREGVEGPWLSTAYCIVGEVFVKRGDLAAAVDQFLKCLALPDRSSENTWESAQRLYYIYDEAGRSEEAAAVRELAELMNRRIGWAHMPSVEAELRELTRRFLATGKR
ncbi:MAG TPA: hypothetical protein VN285_00130 [Candidatus Deferrimicrobium sp.]|nr:hypothetical protein [Candidatus Deferrimicrobium sp.]